MEIAQDIDAAVDLLLLNFVSEKSEAICVMLTPIAVCSLTIYWIIKGMSIAQGVHSHPVREVLGKQLRLSILITLSLSTGVYQTFIVQGLDAMGTAIISAISGVETFAALMDKMAEPFSVLGNKLWSEATVGILPRAALLFAAALVSLSQTVLFSVGLGFYLLAKVSLALTMAVGPVFLLCGIFPSTAKYTENWLGQTLNYIFLKVLICVSVTMLTSIVSQYAEHITNNLATINILRAACALTLCSIVIAIAILFQPQLASALFGGASISGIGRALAYLLIHSVLKERPSSPRQHHNTISSAGSSPARSSNSVRATPLYGRHAMNSLQASHNRRTT